VEQIAQGILRNAFIVGFISDALDWLIETICNWNQALNAPTLLAFSLFQCHHMHPQLFRSGTSLK